MWRIHQEISGRQGYTTQAKGTHNSTAMANNRLRGMVCDFAMVGEVNPAWYCSGCYYSSGKDKDIQTGDTEPPIAHGT